MLQNRRGFTLVEVLLFSTLSVGILLWASTWWAKPSRIQQKMQATLDEKKVLRATDSLVNDLKQIIPGSLRPLPPTDAASVAFQVTGDSMPISMVYEFQPTLGGLLGSLYRIEDGTGTVILTGLLAPNAEEPLFSYDPILRILTLDVRLKSVSGPISKVVRRVALPN